MASKLVARVGKKCVACGCCVKQCRLNAIDVTSGIIAKIDSAKCVGCGKCAAQCPAGIIEICAREGA